jgi:hypothetical protein
MRPHLHHRVRRFVPSLLSVLAFGALVACQEDSGVAPVESAAAPVIAVGAVIPAGSFATGDAAGVETYADDSIAHVDHGDWIVYRQVDFGAVGTLRSFVAKYRGPHCGNRVQVRLGSASGRLLADLVTTKTGPNFDTNTISQSTPLAPVGGVHDVYVAFEGSANRAACVTNCWTATTPACPAAAARGCGYGLGNFDSFQFSAATATVTTPACAVACPAPKQLVGGVCLDACPTGTHRQADASCAALTSVTVAASPTTTVPTQPVVVTAAVAASTAAPVTTGTVTFTVDGVAQAPVAVASGAASLALTTLAVGAHTITATYSGGAGLVASAPSPAVTVTIVAGTTATTVTSSLNPALAYQPVTFVATVAPPIAGLVPGTVTFSVNGVAAGTAAVVNNTASLVQQLPAGAHTVTAAYSGGGGFDASAGSVAQTVTKGTLVLTAVADPNPAGANVPVQFTPLVTTSPEYVLPAAGWTTIQEPTNWRCFRDNVLLASCFGDHGPDSGTGTHTFRYEFLGSADFNPAAAEVSYVRLAPAVAPASASAATAKTAPAAKASTRGKAPARKP